MSDRYVIVRGENSGAFAGVLESRDGREVVLRGSRRLWYWAGAASLSELAVRGTRRPSDCKFPLAVDRHEILDAIEVLDATADAEASIKGVPTWTA